jgi:hypothetical protein
MTKSKLELEVLKEYENFHHQKNHSESNYLYDCYESLFEYTKVMDDDYLEIENTRINWGKFWPILIIIIISLSL